MNNLVYSGKYFDVMWAIRKSGRSESKKFFERLERKEQDKLFALFIRLADTRQITNKQQFNYVDKGIWEFKRDQIRMPCYYSEDNKAVITHGFIKKTEKMPLNEFNRAIRIRKEYLKV